MMSITSLNKVCSFSLQRRIMSVCTGCFTTIIAKLKLKYANMCNHSWKSNCISLFWEYKFSFDFMLKMKIFFFNVFFSSFSDRVRKSAEKCIKENGAHLEHKMWLMLSLLLIKWKFIIIYIDSDETPCMDSLIFIT